MIMSTGYVDIEDVMDRVYFLSATYDDHFLWEEIVPVEDSQTELLTRNPGLTPNQVTALGRVGIRTAPGADPQWADGMRRYRITACAHRRADRDGALCLHCGASVVDV